MCTKLKKYYLIFIFSYIFNIFVIYSSISQFLETSVCISHPVTISGVLAYFGISNMKGLLLFLSRLWNKEISCFVFSCYQFLVIQNYKSGLADHTIQQRFNFIIQFCQYCFMFNIHDTFLQQCPFPGAK